MTWEELKEKAKELGIGTSFIRDKYEEMHSQLDFEVQRREVAEHKLEKMKFEYESLLSDSFSVNEELVKENEKLRAKIRNGED